MREKDIVNCNKCEYFFVTWDKKFPRGCKLFGFKGTKLPSQTVFEASGQKCDSFLNKNK